jgi:hypothetical protein
MTDVRFVKTNISSSRSSAGPPASDKLALCLRGFPERTFVALSDAGARELGYRVWAPLRGYGHSTRPPRARYAIEELLADVVG